MHPDASGNGLAREGKRVDPDFEDSSTSSSAHGAFADAAMTLQLALDAGHMGTWHWDMRSGPTTWDFTLEKLFGLAPASYDGTYETYVSLIHPDDRETVVMAIEEALQRRGDYHVEHRVVHPDGTVRWLECRGRVLTDAAGDPTGTIGCSVDTTDAVTARREVEQANEQLASQIRRASDLAATLQEGLLPQLDGIAGFDIIVRYEPGEERLLLGGDFLDLAITPSGDLGFVLGDVAGHGPVAAALGASLRSAWRGLALTHDDPRIWLDALERVLRSSRPAEEMFATVLTGVVSTAGTVRVLSAGHPAPLVVTVDDVTGVSSMAAVPLGFGPLTQLIETNIELPSDGTLLCFTDGLYEGRIERGSRDRFGTDGLTTWLHERGRAPLTSGDITALLEHVEGSNGARMDDDVAILAISLATPES